MKFVVALLSFASTAVALKSDAAISVALAPGQDPNNVSDFLAALEARKSKAIQQKMSEVRSAMESQLKIARGSSFLKAPEVRVVEKSSPGIPSEVLARIEEMYGEEEERQLQKLDQYASEFAQLSKLGNGSFLKGANDNLDLVVKPSSTRWPTVAESVAYAISGGWSDAEAEAIDMQVEFLRALGPQSFLRYENSLTQQDLDDVVQATGDASESFAEGSFLKNKGVEGAFLRPLTYQSQSQNGQFQRETQSPLVWLRLHHGGN